MGNLRLGSMDTWTFNFVLHQSLYCVTTYARHIVYLFEAERRTWMKIPLEMPLWAINSPFSQKCMADFLLRNLLHYLTVTKLRYIYRWLLHYIKMQFWKECLDFRHCILHKCSNKVVPFSVSIHSKRRSIFLIKWSASIFLILMDTHTTQCLEDRKLRWEKDSHSW